MLNNLVRTIPKNIIRTARLSSRYPIFTKLNNRTTHFIKRYNSSTKDNFIKNIDNLEDINNQITNVNEQLSNSIKRIENLEKYSHMQFNYFEYFILYWVIYMHFSIIVIYSIVFIASFFE